MRAGVSPADEEPFQGRLTAPVALVSRWPRNRRSHRSREGGVKALRSTVKKVSGCKSGFPSRPARQELLPNGHREPDRRRSAVRAVASALLAPAAATLLALAVPHRSPASAASVYILGVVAAAALGGVWSGVGSALLSFIGLNYFFTIPYHTFRVDQPDELVALAVFLLVAEVVGALVARVVKERDRAERSTSEARSLATFTGRLLSDEPLQRSLRAAAEALVVLFNLSSCAIEALVDGEPPSPCRLHRAGTAQTRACSSRCRPAPRASGPWS